MIIDMHVHLWEGLYGEHKARILNAIELYSISKVYVSGLSVYIPSKEQVAGVNLEVARFMREEPDKISGYVYISPEHDNAVDVLKRGIEEQGFAGAKFWVSALCDDMCVDRVMEKIIDYGVPLLVHAYHKAKGQLPRESIGINVANLARRYPEARIIMAHLGGNCYNGLPAIRDCENVWVDFSGTLFRGDELSYAVECLGAARVLFGSDMPGVFLVNLGQVLEAKITRDEKDLILYKNALKLFDNKAEIRMG